MGRRQRPRSKKKKRQKRGKSRFSILPPDMLLEILVRVPVQSIPSCLIVCKSWYDLIRSRIFCAFHFDLILGRTTNVGTMLLRRIYEPTYGLAVLDINSSNKFPAFRELSFNFDNLDPEYDIVGSCCGLVCVTLWDHYSKMDYVYISNPLIKQFLKIPRDENFTGNEGDVFYAFGFDAISKIFKLMRFCYQSDVEGKNIEFALEEHLFDTQCGEWKKLNNLIYPILPEPPLAYVRNHCHWFVDSSKVDNHEALIIAYNLNTDKCRALRNPNGFENFDSAFQMQEIGGSLWMFAHDDMTTIIWKMVSYEDEMWTKMYFVAPLSWGLRITYSRSVCCEMVI
ncbi:hypothetical protein LguiA_020591 [Lonicera macranthoides]